MLRNTLAAALLVLPLAAFAQTPPAADRYVDIANWPTSEAGLDRFAGVEATLNAGFDKICGDTFCEGEFHNLRPMQLTCSVDATKSSMKQCVWTFAGTTASVVTKSGAVQAAGKLYKCKIRLPKDMLVEQFYEAMKADDALNAKLPGSRNSVYDSLVGCL
jgi:hypothetical protein